MKKIVFAGLILFSISTIFAFNKIKMMDEYYHSGKLKELKLCLDTLKVTSNSETAGKLYYFDILKDSDENYPKLSKIYKNTDFGQKAILTKGKELFLKRKYDKAISEFSKLENKFSGKKNYWLALSHFKNSEWRKAIIYAQKFIAFASKSAKKDQCYLIIASSYQNMKYYDKAIDTFKFIAKNVYDIHFIPEITYRLGLCYELKGDSLSALEQYSKVINNYSYSPFFIKTENRLSKSDKKKILKNSISKDIQKERIVVEKKKNNLKKSSVKNQKVSFEKGKYYIQAGAYSTKKYAEIQRKRIRKLGLNSSIKPKKYGKKQLLTVCLGPYQSKKNAQKIVKKLKRKKIQSYIYKL